MIEMQIRRDPAVLEAQSRLYQTGHAGGRFRMADIAFDRSYDAAIAGRRPFPSAAASALTFDRVADRSAGTVRLNVLNLSGGDAGSQAGFFNEPLLRQAARNCDAVRMTVLIDRTARITA